MSTNSENTSGFLAKMTCIAKLILHCIILSTFLPKSDLDYRPIIPLQITHQITKGIQILIFDSFRSNPFLNFSKNIFSVLINNKNHSSAINDTKITEPKIFGLREFNDLEDKNSKVGKSKPTTADGYVKEAATLIAAGKKEEALNAYKAALKMKPVRKSITEFDTLAILNPFSPFRIFTRFELKWETCSSPLVVWKKRR